MQYFKPSDVRTVQCTVQNISASGAAFAVTQDEDAVYIPVSMTKRSNLDVGDMLMCYCIDQTLEENGGRDSSVRYKAIRVKVEQRLSDVIPGIAASEGSDVSPATKEREVTLDEARVTIGECFKKRRAWTLSQLVSEVISDSPGCVVTSEMRSRISFWLERIHESGIVACCRITKKAGDDPITYYASSDDVLIKLVDDYELDED